MPEHRYSPQQVAGLQIEFFDEVQQQVPPQQVTPGQEMVPYDTNPPQPPVVIPPRYEHAAPARGNRKWAPWALACAGVTVSLGLGYASYGGSHVSAENTSANAGAATHHHKPHGHHGTTLPGTTHESTGPSTAPSSATSPSAAAQPLIAVPSNFEFTPPPCTDIKVNFINTVETLPSGKKVVKQTVLPITWDYMKQAGTDIAPSPFVATGKLSGNMLLELCLQNMTAVKYDKAASQRMGHMVETIDVSKTTVTPIFKDPQKGILLNNGIAMESDLDTDQKVLASMQKNYPNATLADVAAFMAPLKDKTNVTKVKDLTLMMGLNAIKYNYQKPIMDFDYAAIVAGLKNEIVTQSHHTMDPNSVTFVPDTSIPAVMNYFIDVPSAKQDAGPFTPQYDLATISAALTDPTGKQLTPEPQQ